MKNARRGAIFWRSALVTAGLVILAIQQGYVSDDVVAEATRWWPLILVGAGLAVIFAGALGSVATALAGVLLGGLIGGLIATGGSFPTACAGGDPGPLEAFDEGTFTQSGADVELDLNCVTLVVAGGFGEGWLVQANEESAADLELDSGDESLEIRSGDAVSLSGRRHVAVVLPAEAGINLSTSLNAGEATIALANGSWGDVGLDGNAASIHFDLSGASVRSVAASLNAGSMRIQLTDETAVAAMDLSANAGSFEVCAPADLGLMVSVGSSVATSHNLAEAGLRQDGDLWQTPNYATARHHIRIVFSGNAAAFTLNPEGGC